jgi:DnaJ domain
MTSQANAGPRPGQGWRPLPGRRRARAGDLAPGDPFTVLGLDPAADLTDDDVRSAWRRIAAMTHPDRGDGGDPERFAVAAAAYTSLRTRSGRGEARAALRPNGPATAGLPGSSRLMSRVRRGRPIRLALRVLGSVAAATVAILAAGPRPAAPALAVGALTWLLITARHDLG